MNVLLSEYNFHETWIRDALKDVITNSSKVAILPFSFSKEWIKDEYDWTKAYGRDEGNYYQEIVLPFKEYGVEEDNIKWLNYYSNSRNQMIDIIQQSDILFLTGGLPEQAVARIRELELEEIIKKEDKIIIGASAGALMQLPAYYVSPDGDYTTFEYFEGLGLIPNDFYIEVHYDESDIQNDCIRRALKERCHTVYAIKDHGGIIIKGNEMTLFGEVKTYKR